MRAILLLAVLLAVLGMATPQQAEAQAGPRVSASCGVKPVKPVVPVGCKDLLPQCGSRGWEWICVPRDHVTPTGPTPRQPQPVRNLGYDWRR